MAKHNIITDEHREEAKRLRAIWDMEPRDSQAVFGEKYNIGNQSAVGQFLNGKAALSLKAATGFSVGLGVPIADFSPRLGIFAKELTDRAVQPTLFTAAMPPPPPHATGETQGQYVSRQKRKFEDDTIHIDQWDTGGSMGYGFTLPVDAGVIRRWSVDNTWVQQNMHRITSVANLCIVTGYGDSMIGMFNPGDPIVVDKGIKKVDIDGVYFFRVADEGYIKRLQRIPTENGLILRAFSENEKYQPFDITKKMDFECLGRIVKIWESTEY